MLKKGKECSPSQRRKIGELLNQTMDNLRELFVSELRVINSASPEVLLVTNELDMCSYVCYRREHGWILLLMHKDTGRLIMLKDFGRYEYAPWKLMMIGGYIPLSHEGILTGYSRTHDGGLDVFDFRDCIFPAWCDSRRRTVGRLKQMVDACRDDGITVYMPCVYDAGRSRYGCVRLTDSPPDAELWRALSGNYKRYLCHGNMDGIVIATPTLEMVAAFGLAVDPARWLVPEAYDGWIPRPEHRAITGVPESLSVRYGEVVEKVNTGRADDPRDMGVLFSIRQAEQALIQLEIDVLRGKREDELEEQLEAILHILKDT